MENEVLSTPNQKFFCGDIVQILNFESVPYLLIDIIPGGKTAIISPIAYFGKKDEQAGTLMTVEAEKLKRYKYEKQPWPLERIVEAYTRHTKEKDPLKLIKVKLMFEDRMKSRNKSKTLSKQ